MKTMKNTYTTLTKIRPLIQILGITLTVLGFFYDYRISMMIIMATMILGGTYFCGWICPYGFLQDIFSRIGRFLNLPQFNMPKYIQRYLQVCRYILLALFTLSSASYVTTLFNYDPRTAFDKFLQGNTMGIILLMMIISFALISLFFQRPFCNYLCVEGAKYGLFSALRPFTIKRSNNTCIDCNKCDQVCPMNIHISTKENIRSTQCINCFECTAVCPVDNTLTYGLVSYTKKQKLTYISTFVIAIVTLGIYGILIQNNIVDSPFPVWNITESTAEVISSNDNENNLSYSQESTSDAISIDESSNTIDSTLNGQYHDGVYTGSGYGFRGEIAVEVVVENGDIASIVVTDHREDRKYYNRSASVMTSSIVESQNTDVDTVTGATYTSRGIIEAVEEALEEARP